LLLGIKGKTWMEEHSALVISEMAVWDAESKRGKKRRKYSLNSSN